VGTFAGVGGLAFSPFGPGGAAARSWKELVADLVRIRYDVEVVVFADAAGTGDDITLEVSAAGASRIRESRAVPTDVAILVELPAGTFPLAAMSQKEFLRHTYGRGPARRFFSSKYLDGEVPDRVVSILRDMVKAGGVGCGARERLGLEFVTGLCRAQGHRILYRLVNLRDMCYGVVVEPARFAAPGWVYFPVAYAAHTLPAAESRGPAPVALYGPRPPGAYPAAALAEFLAQVEAAGGRNRLHTRGRLVQPDGLVAGFIGEAVCAKGLAGAGGGAGLFFHHDPTPAGALAWGGAPVVAVPYDMGEVDGAVYAAGGVSQRPVLPEGKAELAARGLYRNRLYRLFVAEFAALLQSERDGPKRAAIGALIMRTRFSSPSSLAAFREQVHLLLLDFPDDAVAVRGLVAATFARVGPEALRKSLVEGFEATAYDFDRSSLNRLRALGGVGLVEAELARIMRGRVSLEGGPGGERAPAARIPNMFVACSLPSAVGRPQCVDAPGAARPLLKMDADRFEPYVSILAADVLNPMKSSTLGAMTAGVVDGLKFVVRVGERIRVR
jgi:hypothetical protein